MKVKHVIPIVAAGVVSTGTVVLSYFESQRLKEIIATKDKLIECCKNEITAQGKVIEADKKVIEASNVVIEKNREYIEALERVVEKNKEMIAFQTEQIAKLQVGLEVDEGPRVDDNPTLLPEEHSDEQVPSQRGRRIGKEYIFQYDSELKVVAKYDSVTDACSSVGLKSETSVTRVMKGKALSAGGYFWSKGTRPLKKFPDEWVQQSQKMRNRK